MRKWITEDTYLAVESAHAEPEPLLHSFVENDRIFGGTHTLFPLVMVRAGIFLYIVKELHHSFQCDSAAGCIASEQLLEPIIALNYIHTSQLLLESSDSGDTLQVGGSV